MTAINEQLDEVPPAQPAATLVVFRQNPVGGAAQLLMLERAGSMVFAGGATVFPGGRVETADHELALQMASALDLQDAAARIAAVRETLEETGLVIGVKGTVTADMADAARRALIDGLSLSQVLEQQGWKLDLPALVPFARWCPRTPTVRVFDTRFYLADLGTGAVDLAADATENRHLFWATAAEALSLADDGRIRVIFPTRRNLERLAQWPDFAACRAHALSVRPVTISPAVEERDGQPWLVIPSDAGYPIDGEPLSGAIRS